MFMGAMVLKRNLVAMIGALCACSLFSTTAHAQNDNDTRALLRDVYRELVEIDTTAEHGDTARAAQAVAARLKNAGFADADVQVFVTAPHRGNVVARLHGNGERKPILLMAHLDVVEAKREDWSTDPFKLVEKDGYFYGRGTGDDKFMAAAFVANMIRYSREKYVPDRDVILLLETDEEISDKHGLGVTWMLKNQRALIDAEFALNEGGSIGMKGGAPIWNAIQTSEKTYQSFWLEVHNAGGHSALPSKDNAIYRLAQGLTRLAQYDFPVVLNDTTRIYFERMSRMEEGPMSADMKAMTLPTPPADAVARLSSHPTYNSQLRTTCVATRLEGGHADNALPQVAKALVNCRILPGESVEEVQKTLIKVLGDDQIAVTPAGSDTASPPSPLNEELLGAIEQLTRKYWPGIPVLPLMSAGATDGRFLRNAGIPTYGHSGLANDIFDVRAHGKDERVPVKSFYEGDEYLYELVKHLAGGSSQ